MRPQIDAGQTDQQGDQDAAAQDIGLHPFARKGPRQHDPERQIEDRRQQGVAGGEAGVQGLDRLKLQRRAFALEQGLEAFAEGHAAGQTDDQQQGRQPLALKQHEAESHQGEQGQD
ncbi:hypothetical protein D3C86_1684890 [compost metagenome]